MEILILNRKIETKNIAAIEDVEANKKYFLNREAGFVIHLIDGEKMTFKEDIPYETTPQGISRIKNRWNELQKKVSQEWLKDKRDILIFDL